jgi:hypothetical protein
VDASVSGTNTGDNAANSTANTYADGKVEDAIVDGVTTKAPSQNAVYDALAGKQTAGTYSTDIHNNITALNAVSGTNTGDETQTTIKTKLGAATASVDGYATATQIVKLDGIAVGANVGVVPNAAITGATKTKITYDAKWLVTSVTDATTADILNINLKCIDAQNNTDYKETTTFEDMSRVGVGYMRVDIDANDNCIGNVVISNENWANVMFGQHVEFDGSDAEYVVLSKKLSKAKIKSLYPDKADEIEADW